MAWRWINSEKQLVAYAKKVAGRENAPELIAEAMVEYETGCRRNHRGRPCDCTFKDISKAAQETIEALVRLGGEGQ